MLVLFRWFDRLTNRNNLTNLNRLTNRNNLTNLNRLIN